MTRVLYIAGLILSTVAIAGCSDEPEGPEQPIAFFHSVHAGDNQIPCMYCHTTADRSQTASIPSVQLCVGCHVPGSSVIPPQQAQLAFPGPERDSLWNAEAEKLVGFWQRQEAIPWVKVHDLPEHVQFPHFMHVEAGLDCTTCHGPVEEMDVMYQFASLQMGWCVDCHRGTLPISPEEEARVQARSSYVREIAALAASGSDTRDIEDRFPNQRASTDCTVCHY